MVEKNIGTVQDLAGSSTSTFTASGTSPNLADLTSTSGSDKEQKIVTMVVDRYHISRAFTAKLHTRFDDLYKLYMGFTKKTDKLWHSNIFVPTGFTVIETLLPKVMSVLFGKKAIIRISPRTKSDVAPVRILNKLIRYQFGRMGAFTKFHSWIKTTLMYGMGVIKLYWRYEERLQTIIEPKYLNLPIYGPVKIGRRKVKKNIVRHDDPEAEVVDIYDFFLPPRAVDIKHSPWAIQRAWVPLQDILDNPLYVNKDQLRENNAPNKAGMTKNVRTEVNDDNDPSSSLDDSMVFVLYYFEKNRLIVIANEAIKIRDSENPFNHGNIPFYLIKDVEMPHELCGRGELMPIKPLILMRNAIRSQRLDNVKNIVNRKLIINRNADIDLDKIDEDNKPGGIILTDDVGSIKYLDEIDIVASSYKEDQVISRDLQEATAMNETVIGILPSRGETATTINAMQQSAASRFAMKIQSFIETGIRDFVEDTVALDAQFITDKRVVRITESEKDEFLDIAPEEITMNYDYDTDIGIHELNVAAERQQWLELMSTPAMQAPNINREETQRETFIRFGVEDPDRFINKITPEMIAAEAAQGNPQANVDAGGTPSKGKSPSSQSGTPISPAARG